MNKIGLSARPKIYYVDPPPETIQSSISEKIIEKNISFEIQYQSCVAFRITDLSKIIPR